MVRALTEPVPRTIHDVLVRSGFAFAWLVLLASTTATADDTVTLYEHLDQKWPTVPDGHAATFEDQICSQLTELGNMLGQHVDVLSHDMLAMKFDAKRQRAWLRFGGGDRHYLTFRVASDVHFTDGLASVNARIELAVANHTFHFELPSFEMAPVEYRGDHGVEVRLPLLRRNF
jgi:hypothetical protein